MAECNMPSWMGESFIRKFLQLVDDTNTEKQPVNVRCKNALPAGNNYLSDVFKVSIDYKISGSRTLQTKNLFIKLPLAIGPMADFMRQNKLYEKEMKMYINILPKMYALGFETLSPPSYSVTPMKNSLVLEDLAQAGYAMSDRIKRLDLEHCFIFFNAIAKFHAMSVAVHNQEPDLMKSLGAHMLFNQENPKGRNKMKITLENFAKMLSEVGCERYSQMVLDRLEAYWDKTATILKPGKAFNVLCHGDCWSANIMFKHEGNKVVGVKFVDFQQAIYSSFAVDVLLFWWTSANEDVREAHQEELFEVYRTTLNESLARLKCRETLSKEVFDMEVRRIAPFAIFLIGFFSAICYADPDDSKDTDLVLDFDSPNQCFIDLRCFKSKYYRSAIAKLMEQGEKMGMFD